MFEQAIDEWCLDVEDACDAQKQTWALLENRYLPDTNKAAQLDRKV